MSKNADLEYLNSWVFSVADYVSELFGYWDNNQVCRFANAAYKDWFGKSPEQLVNKISLKELLGPLYEQNLPHIKEALRGKTQVFEREVPVISGGTRRSIANYVPHSINGDVKGFFVYVTDANPVKKQHQELKQYAEIIHGQNRLLLNFAHMLSNNLKAYDRSLAAILDTRKPQAREGESGEIWGLMKKISANFGATASWLSEILRLLELAKLQPGHINLHDCINKAAQAPGILQRPSNNIAINNKVSPAIKIFANAAHVETVLANFINRAMQAGDEGQGPFIEFYALLMDKELILEIRDNGPAIDTELDWNRPYDLYSAQNEPPGDNGKGLLINRFLIDSMGGRIKAESKQGKNTVFKIYFKLV